MYAVIETGGKQYRVEVGTELEVELLDGDPGQAVTLDRVLLVADGDETAIGRPLVAEAAVEAQVVRRDRAAKVIVFKYRPKARRRVKKGHRQEHTLLRVTDVRLGSKSAAEAVRKADQEAKTERERLEEAAARQAAADAALAAKLAKSAKPAAAPKPAGPGRSKPAGGATEAAGEGGTPKRGRAKAVEGTVDASATKSRPARATTSKAGGTTTGRDAKSGPAKRATDSTTSAPKSPRPKKDK